jgi:chromate reductase
MSTLKILALCGSLREESTNMGLLRYAQAHAPAGMQIDIADLRDVPFFVRNDDKSPSVERLLKQFEEADAFLFACPEYNYSLAPALKNALDWASRAPDNTLLAGKPAAMMGAGGGMGTSRSQHHLRQVAAALNIHLLNKPEVYLSAFAGGFASNGDVTDESIKEKVAGLLKALLTWTEKLN